MYQFDDRFLESVGLSAMSDEQKEDFLDYAQEQFEIKLGEALASRLSEEQLQEFDKIGEGDSAALQTVLDQYQDYKKDQDYRRLIKNTEDEEMAKMGFVTKKWLDVNCPDYDQMMAKTLAEFQEEIYNQRESILAN